MSGWWDPWIAQPPTASVYELVPKLSPWLMNSSTSPRDEVLRASAPSSEVFEWSERSRILAVNPLKLPDLCVLFTFLTCGDETVSEPVVRGVACVNTVTEQWSGGWLDRAWGFTFTFHVLLLRNTFCYSRRWFNKALYGIFCFDTFTGGIGIRRIRCSGCLRWTEAYIAHK